MAVGGLEEDSATYKTNPCKTLQTEWLQRLDELRNFKRATGHCSVPMKFPSNPGLARWVHTQRMRRRNGKMSAGRARQLEKLGFVFEGRSQWEQVPCPTVPAERAKCCLLPAGWCLVCPCVLCRV